MTTPGPSHAALRRTEAGCLALADISGYTSYLAGAELDHAQDVLEDLTDTVVRALSPPMKLSKLENDGTRVTEYMRHHPGPGQRIAFWVALRVMAGKLAQSRQSLRSMLSAGAGTPPGG